MNLNKKQQLALDSIDNGKNAFITGFAGSGKSFLTSSICEKLKNKNYALTAMTGCASVLIDGTTLHSFMGIGLAQESVEELVKKIRKKGFFKLLQNLEVLIIDEVSMLSNVLFDKLAEIFKIIQTSSKLFGNVQIILVGDMSQLKPIQDDFCFNSKYWDTLDIQVTVLTENMRVRDDPVFEDLLANIRKGKINDSDYTLLKSLKNTKFPEHINPTKLFSINKDVDSINQYNLDKLISAGNQVHIYKIQYNSFKLKESKNYTTQSKIPETIKLCVGAQVMVTRNIDFSNKIINGTQGIIVQLSNEGVTLKLLNSELYYIPYFKVNPGDNKLIDFKYIPLMLSWAISIHKSQGVTIDALEIDLGDTIFACGQAYVAISRGRNKESIKISELSKRSIKTSTDVLKFYEKYT